MQNKTTKMKKNTICIGVEEYLSLLNIKDCIDNGLHDFKRDIELGHSYKITTGFGMTQGHVISTKGKWAVKANGGLKALIVFDQREIAFYYAVNKFDNVVVHNKDGSIDFQMMKCVMDVKLKLNNNENTRTKTME
jgi:hypothetical protein